METTNQLTEEETIILNQISINYNADLFFEESSKEMHEDDLPDEFFGCQSRFFDDLIDDYDNNYDDYQDENELPSDFFKVSRFCDDRKCIEEEYSNRSLIEDEEMYIDLLFNQLPGDEAIYEFSVPIQKKRIECA